MLRAVHGRVGIVQKRHCRIVWCLLGKQCRRGKCNANAGAREDFDSLQDHLAGHGLAHAFGHVHCNMFVAKPVAQHHKLVAANASNNVGWASGAGQSFSNGVQQLVANVVSNVVVDIFQFVQVDKQHAHATLQRDAALECFAQFAQEQHAVWQTCQRIVRCLKRKFVLHLFCFGDVARNDRKMLHRAIGLAHNVQHQSKRAHDAVWAAETKFAFPRVVGRVGNYFAWHLVAYCLNEQLRCRIGGG